MRAFVPIFVDDIEDLGADPSLVAIWIRICRWAAWKPHSREFGGKTFYLARGQLVTAEHALSAAVGVGRSVVRRCLATLVRLGKIAVEVSKAGTMITVRALEPAMASAKETQPETLEPEAVQAGREAVRPSHPAREYMGLREDSYNQTRPDEPHGDGLSPDEAEAIAYAQRRMSRIATGNEAMKFLELWRQVPSVSLAEVKRRIDWFATHPGARAETKSIARVFYIHVARKHYERFDQRLDAEILRRLADGLQPDEIAAEIASDVETLDAETVKQWVVKRTSQIGAGSDKLALQRAI